MYILSLLMKRQFIERLVEMSIARPVAEMLSTYTTQIEAASSLNEEFDLVTFKKINHQMVSINII